MRLKFQEQRELKLFSRMNPENVVTRNMLENLLNVIFLEHEERKIYNYYRRSRSACPCGVGHLGAGLYCICQSPFRCGQPGKGFLFVKFST